MGRTIVADERVQKIIDGYKVENGCGIGLLIGQVNSKSQPDCDFLLK